MCQFRPVLFSTKFSSPLNTTHFTQQHPVSPIPDLGARFSSVPGQMSFCQNLHQTFLTPSPPLLLPSPPPSIKRTCFPESFRSTRAERQVIKRPAMSTVSTSIAWRRGLRFACLRRDWSATERELSWWPLTKCTRNHGPIK